MKRHGDLSYLFEADAGLTDTRVYDPFGTVAAETGLTHPHLGFQADFTIFFRNCFFHRTAGGGTGQCVYINRGYRCRFDDLRILWDQRCWRSCDPA